MRTRIRISLEAEVEGHIDSKLLSRLGGIAGEIEKLANKELSLPHVSRDKPFTAVLSFGAVPEPKGDRT